MPVLLLAACGGDDGEESPPGGAPPPADNQGAGTAPEEPGGGGTPAGGCRQVKQPPPKPEGGARRPRGRLAAGKTYEVTVVTNCGDFTIRIDQRGAPRAAASFVSLARADFFDSTFFHRIAPGFVIQGGDPTGTGSGGPGYTTVDRPPRGTRYSRGTVAMAKAGNEPAGSAGSQFFVVTGDATQLPPDYAVLGRVTRGLEVAERIGTLGDSATEQPTQVVVVRDMRVNER